MKKYFITGLIILSLFILYNCKKESMEEINLNKIARYHYAEKLKLQINQWDIQLDRLEINSKKFEGVIKIKTDKQLLLIRNQRDELLSNLEKIQNSTDRDWGNLEKKIDEAQGKISLAFLKAQSQL
jgi:hypothetical protein